MRAGALRDRLLIEEPVRRAGPYGGTRPSLTAENANRGVFAEVWGLIDVQGGWERHVGDRDMSEVVYRVHIRKLDGIKPEMRIREKYGEKRVFNIMSIQPAPGGPQEVTLICTEAPEWRTA